MPDQCVTIESNRLEEMHTYNKSTTLQLIKLVLQSPCSNPNREVSVPTLQRSPLGRPNWHRTMFEKSSEPTRAYDERVHQLPEELGLRQPLEHHEQRQRGVQLARWLRLQRADIPHGSTRYHYELKSDPQVPLLPHTMCTRVSKPHPCP